MKALRVIIILFVLGSIGVVAYSLQQAHTTGTVQISSLKGYSLAVVKSGYRPAVVGQTTAKIRLAPGDYTIYASKSKSQFSKSITVQAQHSTTVALTQATTTTPAESQATAKINQGNALIKQLPYVGPASAYEVNFTYQYTGKTALPIIIVVGPNQASQQQALDWITSQGFNLSDLTIQHQTLAIQKHNYTNGPPQ